MKTEETSTAEDLKPAMQTLLGGEKRRKRKTRYKCEKCSFVRGHKQLVKHIMRCHTGKEHNKCEICDKAFPTGNLEIHISSVHVNAKHLRAENEIKPLRQKAKRKKCVKIVFPVAKQIKLKSCDVLEKTGEKEVGHISIETHEKKLNNIAGNKAGFALFSQKRKQEFDILISTGKIKNECEFCHELFRQRCELIRHITIFHSGEKAYQCELCHVIFRSRVVCKKHMCSHSASKIYECYLCKERFFTKEFVTGHMLTHVDVVPHACEVCHSVFSQRKYLDKHMLTHNPDYLHECEVCHILFSTRGSYCAHYFSHIKEKGYRCPFCNQLFSSCVHCNRHKTANHKSRSKQKSRTSRERISCTVSPDKHNSTGTEDQLNQCKLCYEYHFVKKLISEQKFLSAEQQHQRVVTDKKSMKSNLCCKKKHVCTVCKKVFSLKSSFDKHMAIHVDAKPHDCEICQKLFPMDELYSSHVLPYIKNVNQHEQCGNLDSVKNAFCRLVETHVSSSSHVNASCHPMLPGAPLTDINGFQYGC